MGHWGYRIVKLKPHKRDDKEIPHYGMFEVYFNDDGSAWSRTMEPEVIEAYGEEWEGDPRETIIEMLEMMLADAKKHPVFEDPPDWPKPDFVPTKTVRLRNLNTGEVEEYNCGKCGGIMSIFYSWDSEDESRREAEISCWECRHTVTQEQLAEAGMQLIKDEEDGQDRDKPTEDS